MDHDSRKGVVVGESAILISNGDGSSEVVIGKVL